MLASAAATSEELWFCPSHLVASTSMHENSPWNKTSDQAKYSQKKNLSLFLPGEHSLLKKAASSDPAHIKLANYSKNLKKGRAGGRARLQLSGSHKWQLQQTFPASAVAAINNTLQGSVLQRPKSQSPHRDPLKSALLCTHTSFKSNLLPQLHTPQHASPTHSSSSHT